MARILVIDDESALRSVLGAALLDAGHTVALAADGRAGLHLICTEPVDLVITDLVMPDQDGIETIIALRHENPALPVIAISGDLHHAALYLEIARHLGVRRTLEKPFTAAALLEAVDEILERVCAV